MNLFIAICCPLLLFLEKYNTSKELTVFFFFFFSLCSLMVMPIDIMACFVWCKWHLILSIVCPGILLGAERVSGLLSSLEEAMLLI